MSDAQIIVMNLTAPFSPESTYFNRYEVKQMKLMVQWPGLNILSF